MLDLDEMGYNDVLYWSRRAMKRFKLGGFLVLESSPGCYHVVFDRKVDWSENMRTVAWVALLSKRGNLRRWFLMQCIKQKPTLRVSKKHELGGKLKLSPRIVHREGTQNNEIAEYFLFRELIFNISKNFNNSIQSCKVFYVFKTKQ